MGAHHAPHAPHVASQAARLAGRGAFTAAAVAVVAGGTASMAFAHEAPTVHQAQSAGHEVQGKLADGAHQLSDAGKAGAGKVGAKKVDADSLKDHGASLKHESSDVASSLKSKASSSVAGDIATDGGHALSNTKNDLSHARYNWTHAAQGGLTQHEVSDQLDLAGDDALHALDNGKNDASHWAGKLASSAPSAPSAPAELPSVLSFS